MRTTRLMPDLSFSFVSILLLGLNLMGFEMTTEWLKLIEEAQLSVLGWDLPLREGPCRVFLCHFLLSVLSSPVCKAGWGGDIIREISAIWDGKITSRSGYM